MSTFHLKSIEHEYRKISASVRELWKNNPGIGKEIGLPEGYHDFGISTGSFFKPNEKIQNLITELKSLALSDEGHVLIPDGCFHFTFLALASHNLKLGDPLPSEIQDLKEIHKEFIGDENWKLEQLRIIPGINHLLLVGFPSEELIVMRKKFAEALGKSSWKPFINSRHEFKGYPFPPIIWHTTLCRYPFEFLSQAARGIFEKYQEIEFGNIELEAPRLRLVNYDWSSTQIL